MIMEEKMLLEFSTTCEENRDKLFELLKVYELAQLGHEIQEQECKSVCNQVLSENEFFAAKEFDRSPVQIKIGDRILDEKYTFLLSDEDFDRLQELEAPILVEQEITDERGYYLTNWLETECDARRNLVNFIILNIVPESMRELFWKNRLNIVFCHKLIDAFKNSIKGA